MPAIKLKKVTAQYIAEKEKKQAAEKEKEKKKNLEDVADEAEKKSHEEKNKKEKGFNFLDVEVLWEKRKRTIPVTEQKLLEWLEANLEKREAEVSLPLPSLYEYYAETCQLDGATVVDIPVFNKHVHDKFGSTFGFKELSPYKGLLKERKKKEKKPRVQGETLNLKLKDILEDVISSAGNPRRGIRFGNLKVSVNAKYPALRVDLHPKKMKNALERGIRYGQIELVKGVGMCGFYRLPGEPDHEEEPDKKVKKKKSKESKSSEAGEEDGKEKEDKEQDNDKEVTNGATEEGKEVKKRSRKRKKEEKEKEGETEGGEKDTTDSAEPKKKKPKKKAQKKKKKKSDKPHRNKAAQHSDPQRIDDVFPLAVTYQSDPKEASVSRIKTYIMRHYPDCTVDRMKKALENGGSKGLWEQVRGHGGGGSFRLLIDTFNPSLSDSMDDRICQAIVACHEPKQASASLLKKYVQEYHAKFNTEAKPHLFKSALERACHKGIIRQLTGIGASGSFQLVEQFFPSPAILAGEMESDSEAEESEDEDVAEVYVPRATKYGRAAGRVAGSSKKPAGGRRR